jgi:predicted metal-dependent phosphoesterase TrpH
MSIDLHLHTTASDGTLSPTEIVRYAKQKRLEAIAITDHDTVEGVEEALLASKENGIEVVPGIEISAEYPNGTLHILGYYIDFKDKPFLEQLAVLQKARSERNPRIARKLQELGLDIGYEEVQQEAGTGQVGRPHFAQVLVKKGFVHNIQEAFEKYLKKGASAYMDKFRFQVQDAITSILDSGGIPVLSHPFTLNCRDEQELTFLIERWMDFGLQGIEVYYSEHNASQTRLYEKIADQYNLLTTGGSDFHGNNIQGIDLGSGRKNLDIPYTILDRLKVKKSTP